MGTIWGTLKLILELWDALKVFLGFVKSVKHESENKEISDESKIIENPNSTDEERLDEIKDLENLTNKHT